TFLSFMGTIGTNNDDGEATVALPFPFRFYGTDYSSLLVGTNGYVTFDTTPGSGRSLGNTALPDPSTPNALIALYWDDLETPSAETFVEGTAPNRKLIIQWEGARRFESTGSHTDFQLWLFEGGSGHFEIHYGPTVPDPAHDFTASVGIEDATG